MPSLKDTRRRIVSVRNTQKITRAMKLVSAAKYARANNAVNAARPYEMGLSQLTRRVFGASDRVDVDSPLIRPTGDPQSVLLIVVATDKGLCGGLNNNLFKRAAAWIAEQRQTGSKVDLAAWGRRAILFADKQKVSVVERTEKVLDRPGFAFAQRAAGHLSALLGQAKYGRVAVAYNQFVSVLSQEPKVEWLLPISRPDEADASDGCDPEIEPDLASMADRLLATWLSARIYRLLLEGAASEHGARMSAMDNATNNAKEVIRKLTLRYNRGRQAAITKELIEIISGAEAL